jgi:transposase
VLDEWKPVIDGWLLADRDAPRKQRHTARRIWQRLVVEHDAQVGESTVRAYVAAAKRDLPAVIAEVKVPQTYAPGSEAEVDFGDVWFDLNDVRTKGHMFVMRLSASGKAFHYVYLNEAQQAFLDGHVRAFEFFGGVPSGRIRYDNLSAAVVKVLKGRDREETVQFRLLRSHYRFDSFFCEPGLNGAHEKGGVEGEIGRFRRNHLVPVPNVSLLAELNAHIAAAEILDDRRLITGRSITVGDRFATEASKLMPLPGEPFDPALLLRPRVDSKSRVSVRQNFYSVPVRFVGQRIDVALAADTITATNGAQVVACHTRLAGKYGEALVLDHYLETLVSKPGALAGSTALAAARQTGSFTRTHDEYLKTARRRLGDQQGTRALIEILLAHRTLPADAITAGIQAALAVRAIDPQVVIIEARRHTNQHVGNDVVVPIGNLERYDRPAPCLDRYDNLLLNKKAQ